jgi:mRNA interferase MazF
MDKIRPAVIVSNDIINRISGWATVTIVPLSSTEAQKRRPGSLILPGGTGGLNDDSAVVFHQVATIDRNRLMRQLGQFDANTMTRIDRGLRDYLSL